MAAHPRMAASASSLPPPGVLITGSELERLRQVVGLIPTSQSNRIQAPLERERAISLHERSLKRAASWTNTLEGARRCKREERQKQLDEIEFARQRVDHEEAKLQLDLRKATIERANRIIREDNDQFKSFQAKLMLCDVLAEREAQVKLKDELKKLDQIRDDRYLNMDKINYRKMLEREMKEKQSKEELSKLTAKVQRQQLAEYKERRFRQVEDEMLEGELIRRRALQDLEEETATEHRRRERAVQAVQETQKANEYLKELKAQDLFRQQREEEKIKDYAARKEHMLQLRKQKEEEVHREKLAQRQAMIDAQAKRLAEMQRGEDERVERDVKAKDEADAESSRRKAEYMRRWQEDISSSRQLQIERRHQERQRQVAEDRAAADFSRQWCRVLDHQDEEEREAKRAAAKALAREHQKQVEIQRRRREEEKRLDAMVAEHAQQAMSGDGGEFNTYAQECICNYSAEGKNILPLIKALVEMRKQARAC